MGRVGGNLRTLSYILEQLDRRVFEPVVVAPMETEFLQRMREAGTECVVVEPPASIGRYGGKVLRDGPLAKLRNITDLIQYNRSITRFIRERGGFDVIYANSIRAVLSVGLAARTTKTPLLWYIKGELNNPWLDRAGFALADRVLFFCETNRDDKYPSLIAKHLHKIGILKIGIDWRVVEDVEARDKSATVRELALDPAHLNTLVLGQLYRPKGQHLAIEAMSRLAADFPQARLYIVGDHVIEEYRGYRDELDALVAKYGLQDRVIFTGWRTDALDILASVDIVLHPSLSEGFGRAVLEAMALGRPVVASKVGGLREIIRHGENGFLVDPGDVNAITEHWRALLADASLRETFSRNAREAVRREYLLSDKIDQLAGIWHDMATKGSPRVRNRG
jgi:L-malate glycosyltransferase